MIHLLPDSDEFVRMFVFDNKIIFKINNIVFLTSVINATFPDTSRLVPNEFKVSIVVNLNDFYSAIDRASLLSNNDEKNTMVKRPKYPHYFCHIFICFKKIINMIIFLFIDNGFLWVSFINV